MSNARTLASTINSSSQIVVPSGGINFADIQTAASGTTSEILDGYEEGTWNLTLPNAVSATFTKYGDARYTKIGDIVHAYFNIYINGNTDSENVRATLPFVAKNNQTITATEGIGSVFFTTSTIRTGIVLSATNVISFNDSSYASVSYSTAASKYLYVYVVYQAA